MENRLICEILILSEGPSLSIAEYQVNVVPLSELITMIACWRTSIYSGHYLRVCFLRLLIVTKHKGD